MPGIGLPGTLQKSPPVIPHPGLRSIAGSVLNIRAAVSLLICDGLNPSEKPNLATVLGRLTFGALRLRSYRNRLWTICWPALWRVDDV